MTRLIKIDKTLTGEEIVTALQSQFSEYQITTNRSGKRIFVKIGRTGGVVVIRGGNKLHVDTYRSGIFWKIFFLFFDWFDFSDLSRKPRVIESFLIERFKAS